MHTCMSKLVICSDVHVTKVTVLLQTVSVSWCQYFTTPLFHYFGKLLAFVFVDACLCKFYFGKECEDSVTHANSLPCANFHPLIVS